MNADPAQAELPAAPPMPMAERAEETDPGAMAQVRPLAPRGRDTASVMRVWRRLLREPSLLVTVAYVFVSFIGLWANYWFYRGFNLPILEYMQASDYLVAGLRDPVYALLLAVLVIVVWLITWPETYRRDHPERADVLRRKWWGRLVFPDARLLSWKGVGIAPETGVVLVAFSGMVWLSSTYVLDKAAAIRDGEAGHRVRVTLAGGSAPLPQTARLLGSSGAYVFLWWPRQRLAEAVPIESIGRLQSMPRHTTAALPATTKARAGIPRANATK